jgi:hypothetical protein
VHGLSAYQSANACQYHQLTLVTYPCVDLIWSFEIDECQAAAVAGWIAAGTVAAVHDIFSRARMCVQHVHSADVWQLLNGHA